MPKKVFPLDKGKSGYFLFLELDKKRKRGYIDSPFCLLAEADEAAEMKKSENFLDFDLTNAESVLNFFLMLRLIPGDRSSGGAVRKKV